MFAPKVGAPSEMICVRLRSKVLWDCRRGSEESRRTIERKLDMVCKFDYNDS